MIVDCLLSRRSPTWARAEHGSVTWAVPGARAGGDMLRFKVFKDGAPAKSVDLTGAYLVGSDRVPLRAELKFSKGEIVSDSRARGAAAVSLMWPVGDGRMMLETPRLPERQQPYNLHVELARGQMMRISQKREDWGLYDFPEGQPYYDQVDAARARLIDAVTAPDDIAAAEFGEAAIAAGVEAGEALTTFHAGVFLQRRRAAKQMVKLPLGCRIDASQTRAEYLHCLTEVFQFGVLPFRWAALEPKEGAHRPARIDVWLKHLQKQKLPAWGASLLSLDEDQLPDWLHRWAKDYDHFRASATKYIQYVLKTYGPYVQAWEAVSGIHARSGLGFTYDQILELTRTSCLLVKQLAPKSSAIIGITLPWGEYYPADPRTIPPLLYAEMAVQNGIHFDAFGLEIRFGTGDPGHYVRDMLQVSALLDRFGGLGKPLHIIAAGVPSGGGNDSDGCWRGKWSAETQAEWVKQFYRIALSKPFVETVTCLQLADATDQDGLLDMDSVSKPAYQEVLSLKRELAGDEIPEGRHKRPL